MKGDKNIGQDGKMEVWRKMKGEKNMNLEKVTIEDATEMYEKKNMVAVIKSGKVVGFEEENEKG